MAVETGMQAISTGDTGTWATVAGILVTIGAGIKWFIGWRDTRQDLREKKLEAWEEQLRKRDAGWTERIEDRLEEAEKKVGALSAALFVTISEVQVLDPASPILVRARVILQQAYAVPEDMPEDIAALVHRLGVVRAD